MNSGSIDGDAEGSERYTEGRLPKIAYTLLEDVLDKQCVEFKPNYAETTTEPITLPALFPNFLANGCPTGIAVGYTSCVPSHNLNELCDGIIYAIKNEIPNCIKAMLHEAQLVAEGKAEFQRYEDVFE